MSVIAFFSNSYELDILKNRSDFNELKLIALTPDADFSLMEFPDRRKTIEDYYDEKELNIVGNSSLEKVNEICKAIDNKFFKENTFFSCSDVYMFMKVLWDQLLINHTFCDAIFRSENPKEVIIFNEKKVRSDFVCDSYDDLLIGFIDYFFHQCHGVLVTCLSFTKAGEGECLFSILNFKDNLKKFLSGFRFDLISMIYRFKNKKESSVCIIQHYDFLVAKEIRKHFRVFFLKNKQLSFSVVRNYKKDYSSIRNFFSINEISYFDLIEKKIDNLINEVSLKFITMVKTYAKWMLRMNIKAVVAASGQSLHVLAGIKAAKLNKIPIIWGQHGGFYGYSEFPILKYINQHYSYYFLYSKGCFSINNQKNCFSVSNKKLQDLYFSKRFKNDY